MNEKNKDSYGERLDQHFNTFGLTLIGRGREFLKNSSRAWSSGAMWTEEQIIATVDGLKIALQMCEQERRDPGCSGQALAKIALKLPLGIDQADREQLLSGAWANVVEKAVPERDRAQAIQLMTSSLCEAYEVSEASSNYFRADSSAWGLWIKSKGLIWIESRARMALAAFEAIPAAGLCRRGHFPVRDNVMIIGKRIGADKETSHFLARMLLLLKEKGHATEGPDWMFTACRRQDQAWSETWSNIAKTLGIDLHIPASLWHLKSFWVRCGLVKFIEPDYTCGALQWGHPEQSNGSIMSVADALFEINADHLMTRWASEEELLSKFYVAFGDLSSELGLADWDHVGSEITDVAAALRNKPVKILLWGDPGAGKSSLANALARDAGKVAIAPAPIPELWANSRQAEIGLLRLRAVDSAERLGQAAGNAMLVVDECETILKNVDRKQQICESLESRSLPQIWIANSLTDVNEAFLRRFDFALEIPAMPLAARERLALRLFKQSSQHGFSSRLARSMRSPAELVAARNWCEAAGEYSWPVVVRRMAGHQHAVSAAIEKENGSFMEIIPAGSVDPDIALSEFAGSARLLTEIQRISRIFAEPERFSRLGAKMPKGYLLAGPPGSGKTLFVRVLAKVAGVPVVVSNGAALASEPKYFARLFAEARKRAPCLVFVDEFDVCAGRAKTKDGLNLERQKILNQLLVELDGFDPLEGVMFLGATHNGDAIDSSVTRSGRLERTLIFSNPNPVARQDIWRAHLCDLPSADSYDWTYLAQVSRGFSCAEIAAASERARLEAAFRGEDVVSIKTLKEACDLIYWGEPGETYLNDAGRWSLAIHEAGHAMAAAKSGYLPERATIRPRDGFLGAVAVMAPEGGEALRPRQVKALLRVNMAGYAAEIAAFGYPSSGASSDLQSSRSLLTECLLDWGLGAVPATYIGNPVSGRGLSQRALEQYEDAARTMMDEALSDLAIMFAANRGFLVLEVLARELLEKREMDREEIENCIRVAEASLFEPPGIMSVSSAKYIEKSESELPLSLPLPIPESGIGQFFYSASKKTV